MVEENYRKNVTVDGSPCTAYIIDTAGQVIGDNLARIQGIERSAFKGRKGVSIGIRAE